MHAQKNQTTTGNYLIVGPIHTDEEDATAYVWGALIIGMCNRNTGEKSTVKRKGVNQWVQKEGTYMIIEIHWVAIYLPDLADEETRDHFWVSPEVFCSPWALSAGLQCRYAEMQRASTYGMWQLDTFTKVMLNMRMLHLGQTIDDLGDLVLDEDDPEYNSS